MSHLKKTFDSVVAFLIDYGQRHAHPVNALLHLFGVPLAFVGLLFMFSGRLVAGLSFLVAGYVLQYLGHRVQGNEVGEVTLLKHLWAKVRSAGES